MSDQTCTARPRDGEAPPNPLFTPPCTCPDCAPVVTYEASAQDGDDGWLRVSGDRQRYRVERFELGSIGRAVLG